jgi:hypothetical protein
MRLRIGPLPLNPEFRPEQDGWNPLKEPGPLVLQLLAVPIGVLTAGALIAGWWLAVGEKVVELSPLPIWFALFGVIPVHELLHASAQPGYGLRPTSILGLWPSKLTFYAHYLDPMPRDRLLLIFVVPFVVLSVVPLLVCGVVPVVPGWVVVMSVWNAFLSCGDMLGMLLIASQVPRSAMVCNQGWFTWWKAQDEG